MGLCGDAEQSQLGALPVDVTTTENGALQLLADIEANYECTYPVFYMTWGRQDGDPGNCASFPFMCTYDGMQQGLRTTYLYLATMNDAHGISRRRCMENGARYLSGHQPL